MRSGDALLMSYGDRAASLSIGCLPATVFGAVIGSVAFIPHQRFSLLPFILVLGALCGLITWATNATVPKMAQRGRGAAWGVAAGFLLAGFLGATLCALLIVSTT